MELGKYIEKGYGKAENACVFSNSFPFLKMDVEMYFMLVELSKGLMMIL